MSNFAINAVRIEAIFPIEKADRIEIAQVGLFRSVVGKGVYRAGQPVIYIPESAILPDPLIADLGLTLAGSGHNRVKAIHLRGELSQGIVCLPSALAGVDLEAAIAEDHDFAADLEFGSRLAKRVFLGRFLFGSVPARMVQFTRRSPRFSAIIQDLFAGKQPYLGLKRRLLQNLNGSLYDVSMSLGFSRLVPRKVG